MVSLFCFIALLFSTNCAVPAVVERNGWTQRYLVSLPSRVSELPHAAARLADMVPVLQDMGALDLHPSEP